jgi:transcriptional regulator with XRE-family HTH domain
MPTSGTTAGAHGLKLFPSASNTVTLPNVATSSGGHVLIKTGVHGRKSMAKRMRGRSSIGMIDDYVARRIRERRIMLGLTQQHFAEMIGVSYQQAHKYERGLNRISAGRLFEVARALSVPLTYFYENLGEESPRQITPHQRMLLEIARNFTEIRSERQQEAVSQLVRVLASTQPTE